MLPQRLRGACNGLQGLLYLPVASDIAERLLEVAQRILRACDGIMHALTTDALFLCNLGQREVLMIVQLKAGCLLIGQKRAIGII